jgi:hypothetical protein
MASKPLPSMTLEIPKNRGGVFTPEPLPSMTLEMPKNRGGVFTRMVGGVLGTRTNPNPERLTEKEWNNAGNPYFLLEGDLRAAADQIYRSGSMARDARSEHLRRMLYGNDAETQAAVNAGQTEAKIAGLRPAGTGNNAVRPEDELAGGMSRVKALSRIAMATSDAGKMNLLQARMQAAQAGRGMQATGLRSVAKFNEMLSGYQGGMDAVNRFNDANKANFLGGMAGMGLGGAANLWMNRGGAIDLNRNPMPKVNPTNTVVSVPGLPMGP